MGREGWIYAVAFLAILGVGGMLIVPRLREAPQPAPAPGAESPVEPAEPGVTDRPEGPEVAAFSPAPSWPWAAVEVSGTGGPLRGPLREVLGATVEASTASDAPRQALRVRPLAGLVWFGAAGHQWVAVRAGALVDGYRVELPDAAPPLIVRVREADGRPAAGVPVGVLPAPPGEPARTDGGGTVVFDHLPSGLAIVDLTSGERAGPRLRLWAGRDRDVRVTLEPAWTIVGRVESSDGRPLPAARVFVHGPAGLLGRVEQTGADGRFAWHGPATARASLSVRASGWAERSVELGPPALAPLETDLGVVALLGPGTSLDGVVHALHQEPDAHVLVEPAVAAIVRETFGDGQVLDRPRRVALDADGRFALADLPPDLPLRVSVRGAGVPVDLIARGLAGAKLPVVLEPPRGATLAGVLGAPDGTPAAGVSLFVSREARDGDRALPDDLVVVTGADGSFRLRGLAGSALFLRAYAPGCRSLLRRVELPLVAPLRLAFEAALTDTSRRVTGRVLDERGEALPGVTVRAAGVEAHTAGDGRFTLEGVESLAPSVALTYGYESGALPAQAPDPRPFAAPGSLPVAPGTETGDLLLRRTGSLRFRLLDAIDDAPIAFAHVVARSDAGHVLVDRGVATRNGEVELTGLAAGSVELTIVTHARRFARSAVPLQAGETKDLGDLLMPHGMHIDGRVVDEDGQAVPDARIGAYGRGWQNVGADPGAERELLFRSARADAQGRFAIEGFDPRKPADLAVWAPDRAPTAVRVALPPFSEIVTTSVEVTLVRGVFLVLDLRETGGRGGPGPPIRGALVDLEYARDGSDWLDLVQAGALGGPLGSSEEWAAASEQLLPEHRGSEDLVLGPLRPGPYELWVVHPGYVRLRRRLTVIDPAETILVDVLRGEERTFAGRVTRLQFEMDPAR